jgi:hypothetical protein
MEFLKSLHVWHKRIAAGVIGAAAGYAYYYYIGCMSGTCPITSNPYISTLYGTVAGILLVNGKKKPQENDHGNNNSTAANQKV